MEPGWVPESVDVDRPSLARIYDYMLGGFHNFAVDRELARAAIAAMPDAAVQAQANRAFLHRAVRFLVDRGVRQFLDLGSGIPTLGNVHEIAQGIEPQSRVVYVDIDPVAVSHSQQILAGNERAITIHADMRQPERIFADEQVRRVLDLDEPFAVLAVAVLHAISDADNPHRSIAAYREAQVAGSYLVVAHGAEGVRDEESKRLLEIAARTTTPLTRRTPEDIARFFDGYELVPPGLVWASLWHPDAPSQVPDRGEDSGNLVGVGRKL
ncbi:MAG: SAM-dependent methyltransferase [Micromonosporaceae bacterium]|nr:SAM-dependent methyltransferase [Micromonosporaceae bacterium]